MTFLGGVFFFQGSLEEAKLMQIYGKLILNGTYLGGIKIDANILLVILREFPFHK